MKLWGGRFGTAGGRAAERFTASIGFDWRLYREDIEGSQAHVRMLAIQGIITREESDLMVAGLEEIRQDIERCQVEWRREDEDIHMNIERMLLAKVGPVAGKMHTARSRNDQVALDLRLFLRRRIDELATGVAHVQSALLAQAGDHIHTIMPGYTHLQVGQPVSLAHHLLAYFDMLERDQERLADCRRRTDVSPLGACALGGTSFPIDPEEVAAQLDFKGVFSNSIDAVSDRDFVVEFLASGSLVMVHLSRLAEELVLWSSQEFGFVELDEAWTGGSSIMPQKKNPDSLELVRGKTGRVIGHLTGMLTVLKGLPLAYNSDLQEDKEALFAACDTLEECLSAMAQIIATTIFCTERMARAAEKGYSTATELADFLVGQGLTFRDAHAMVGSLVALAESSGRSLDQLEKEELWGVSPLLGEECRRLLSVQAAVKQKRSRGGTGPTQVTQALAQAQLRLEQRVRST